MSAPGSDGVRDSAELARLPPPAASLLARCRRVLAAFSALPEDTVTPEPPPHPAGLHDVLRDDTPRHGLLREEALAAAPETTDGRVRVPRVRDVP